MPTRRQERVAKRVVQELVEAIRKLKNAEIGFITFTRCEVSPDLRHAKVFVSVFGTEEVQARGLQFLRNNASRLRGLIGRPLGTRVVPDLHFEFDNAIAYADNMSRLIADARKTDVNPNPLTPEEEAAFAAMSGKGGKNKHPEPENEADVFEVARLAVEEEERFDDDEDDPSWQPINLNQLPDDDDEEHPESE